MPGLLQVCNLTPVATPPLSRVVTVVCFGLLHRCLLVCSRISILFIWFVGIWFHDDFNFPLLVPSFVLTTVTVVELVLRLYILVLVEMRRASSDVAFTLTLALPLLLPVLALDMRCV